MMQLEQAPSIRTTIVRRLAPSYAAMGRFGLILVMLLMMAVLTILQPAYFLTRENLTNIARQISSNSILALGEFAVIVTAGIDLSVGSVMGLSMIVLALAVHAHTLPTPRPSARFPAPPIEATRADHPTGTVG